MDFLPEVALCGLYSWSLWSGNKTVCFSIAPPPSVKIVRWILSNRLSEIHLRRKARSRKLVHGNTACVSPQSFPQVTGPSTATSFPLCLGCGRLAPCLVGRVKRRWLFAALGGCTVIFGLAIHHLLPGYHNIPYIHHISVNKL